MNSETTDVTGIAIVGCGFVADYYLATLNKYPGLAIRGVFDIDAGRLSQFCEYYQLHSYDSFESLLADKSVTVVLNLTNPRAHFDVSLSCLEAGKHVYSEKPLAMSLDDAEHLIEVARSRSLRITAAPCSVLSKAARTFAHAVRQEPVGTARLVYAELEDGLVHKMPYQKWRSVSGAPWPYRDEFEVGCTIEHAAYYLTWLIDVFGAVRSVTAFSDCLIPEKIENEPDLDPPDTADFSIGVLSFESGMIARLSTGIVAEHDHSLRLFGDSGILYVDDCWDNESAVYCRSFFKIRRRVMLSPFRRKISLPNAPEVHRMRRGSTRMDFLLGVQNLADAIRGRGDLRLNESFVLHVTEVTLALQNAGTRAPTYMTRTRI